ncbi:hypothetical protein KI387_005680, partial [Taxus chinensis]
MQGKGKQRDNSSPFNVIEQMKRKNLNISMWESLAIPRQRDPLQVAMENWSTSNQSPNQQEKILTNAAHPEGNHGRQQ